jgi:hypothetical protein
MSPVFWVLKPCSWEGVGCFGGTYRLYLQGRRVGPVSACVYFSGLTSWVEIRRCPLDRLSGLQKKNPPLLEIEPIFLRFPVRSLVAMNELPRIPNNYQYQNV